MGKILKDPLVHFLVLGLGLFVLFDLVASDEAAYDSKVIDVEIGQVLFVLALVIAFLVLRPLFVRLLRSASDNDVHWSSLTVPASYLIGSVASMWMIERVAGFWA